MIQKFKRWVQDKIGIGENRDKLHFLEKRVKLNHAMIHLLLPETLQLNAAKRPLSFFAQAKNLTNVALAIHKNDLMFLGILYNHEGDINKSLNEYYQVGYNTASQIAELLKQKNPTSFLDFGAGYGRVARFLPAVLPNAIITASDIKEESVTFCESKLQLNGWAHSANPHEVNVTQTFDAVFAGSVFTHLPQQLAEQWLELLANATSSKGTLIFSIHNIETYGFASKGNFHFHKDSEDAFFSWVDDSLEDSESYGTAYISKDLATKWMDGLGFDCDIKPMAFGGTQDLVVATKRN